MAGIKWIKLSTDIFRSRKFLIFDGRKDRDSVELLWIKLLTLAAEINDGGRIYVTESVPHSPKTLASLLLRSEKAVRTALELFEQYDMIRVEKGFISITNWDKYQSLGRAESLREYNRMAKRRSREKQKLVNDLSMTGNDLVNNVKGTEEREREKEKEIRTEEKKEREKVSLPPSALSAADPFSFSMEEDGMAEEDSRLRAVEGPLGRGLVLLSDRQEAALLERLSVEEYDHYLNVIATQIERGKTYGKTHYQAILDMVAQDRSLERR